MDATFWASEKPTMLSGEINFMNGYCDACAIVAASAVLPEPGGPCSRTLTRGVRVEVRTWSTNSLPERRMCCAHNQQDTEKEHSGTHLDRG